MEGMKESIAQREIPKGNFLYNFELRRREWSGGIETRIVVTGIRHLNTGETVSPSWTRHWFKLDEKEQVALMRMAEIELLRADIPIAFH
jgi:hypothetical protein